MAARNGQADAFAARPLLKDQRTKFRLGPRSENDPVRTSARARCMRTSRTARRYPEMLGMTSTVGIPIGADRFKGSGETQFFLSARICVAVSPGHLGSITKIAR